MATKKTRTATRKAPVKKTAPAKTPKVTKAKPAPAKRKLSALDAAAKLLGDVNASLTAREMIETMAARGLWTSPGGKTPEATLYAAIIREIARKGSEARFRKHDRGRFVASAATTKVKPAAKTTGKTAPAKQAAAKKATSKKTAPADRAPGPMAVSELVKI